MLDIRLIALSSALITAAANPALATTCNFTIGGARVLSDSECVVTRARGTTRIDAGNLGIVVVRRSVLSSSIVSDRPPFRRASKRSGLHSYGQVVESTQDDKLCFFNKDAVLCVEE